MSGKRCSKCGETKPHDAFYANSRDGFQAWCKACYAAYKQALKALVALHTVEYERLLIIVRHSAATRYHSHAKRQYLARKQLVDRHRDEFDRLLLDEIGAVQ